MATLPDPDVVTDISKVTGLHEMVVRELFVAGWKYTQETGKPLQWTLPIDREKEIQRG